MGMSVFPALTRTPCGPWAEDGGFHLWAAGSRGHTAASVLGSEAHGRRSSHIFNSVTSSAVSLRFGGMYPKSTSTRIECD